MVIHALGLKNIEYRDVNLPEKEHLTEEYFKVSTTSDDRCGLMARRCDDSCSLKARLCDAHAGEVQFLVRQI